MGNTTLTASIIAKEALMILKNNLVMANNVYRGLEEEFDKKVNGYEVGDTVSIRRPGAFTVRKSATASAQDHKEGKKTFTVGTQAGVDFAFTSQELTLKIGDIGERVMKPALTQLAHEIDLDLMKLYYKIPNWVGTPGQRITNFAAFSKGPERLDEMAVPIDDRMAVLSPNDNWGLLGSQTGLYIDGANKDAYRKAKLGMLGNTDTYMAQSVPTHTVGVATGSPLINGNNQDSAYDDVKDTMTQTLNVDGWTNSVTGILKAGDVFTIEDVYDVNPRTKQVLPYLKMFSVQADANSGASTGPTALTIYPAIIASGAFQNVSAAPVDGKAITVIGTGGGKYRQNMVFHRNAFGLVMVPMVKPPGAIDVARKSDSGISVRVIPVYDGTNDKSMWRLDVLYGADVIDPRLATRLSGTSS